MQKVGLLFAVLMSAGVVADLAGLWSLPFGESDDGSDEARLPGEYLYLDDERVQAYLGQLREGLSDSQERTLTTGAEDEIAVGKADVLGIGATRTRESAIKETVVPTATERYYQLEGQLSSFEDGGEEQAFRPLTADADGCGQIAEEGEPWEGTDRPDRGRGAAGSRVRAPTGVDRARAAVLSKLQRDKNASVTREALTRLARFKKRQLAEYLRSFGDDPRIPLRLTIPAPEGVRRNCQILLPVRYLNLTDAPSLLTGKVTIVGKVVRHLRKDERYYDVESAVTYGNTVEAAGKRVRETLGLARGLGPNAVGAAAIIEYPGLVVLPVAMYK